MCKNIVKLKIRFAMALHLLKKRLNGWLTDLTTDGKKTRIVKVMVWRITSIFLTLTITAVMTGDVAKATGFTLILHFVLTLGHWLFETQWEKYIA